MQPGPRISRSHCRVAFRTQRTTANKPANNGPQFEPTSPASQRTQLHPVLRSGRSRSYPQPTRGTNRRARIARKKSRTTIAQILDTQYSFREVPPNNRIGLGPAHGSFSKASLALSVSSGTARRCCQRITQTRDTTWRRPKRTGPGGGRCTRFLRATPRDRIREVSVKNTMALDRARRPQQTRHHAIGPDPEVVFSRSRVTRAAFEHRGRGTLPRCAFR